MIPKVKLGMRLAAVLLVASLSHGRQAEQATVLSTEQRAAEKYFTDTVLVDQNGKEQRFYTDLIKGKVVIINPMYATCKDSCPMMSANLARIQKWLGTKLGSDVHLLSISLDPETDTSRALKEYGAQFNARPGWYFLTGKKENVELVLRRLGLYVDDKQEHLNLFLIGNDRTGMWKKALGIANSEKLIGVVQSVLEDPQQATSPQPGK
jgi:protein SCO1/2